LEKPINTVSPPVKLRKQKTKRMRNTNQIHVYKIDLTRINGSGEFPCLRCGNVISPDDTTEKAYSILEPKVNSQGLKELVIQCNKCGSFIHLTGFSLLQDTHRMDQKKTKTVHKEETLCYITHI
jgi:hypothetical protein